MEASTCEGPSCLRPQHASGLCLAHWRQFSRAKALGISNPGAALKPLRPRKGLAEPMLHSCQVLFPETLWKPLQVAAKAEGRSLADLVREAVATIYVSAPSKQ